MQNEIHMMYMMYVLSIMISTVNPLPGTEKRQKLAFLSKYVCYHNFCSTTVINIANSAYVYFVYAYITKKNSLKKAF